ncbi:MAG: SCO1/SenC family protein [Ignavibacteria bacterium]|nr:SCO1/SenC family protein [Ignavibacteria bacterium]
MKYVIYLIVIFALLNLTKNQLQAKAKTSSTGKVGIEENLGKKIPLDLKFLNSYGDTVLLSDIIKKPTLLSFIYFNCAGICNPLQNALADGIDRLKLVPGKEYQVITLCFDHRATLQEADKWRKNNVGRLKNPFPVKAWYVLIGDSISIKKLTESVGFYFKDDGYNNYIHAGSIFAISPNGIISRYLNFDQNYNPFDLKMALLEASQDKSNPTIKTVLQYCFSYDPQGKRYVFNTTKVIGIFMLIAALTFFTVLVRKDRKKRNKNKSEGTFNDSSSA